MTIREYFDALYERTFAGLVAAIEANTYSMWLHDQPTFYKFCREANIDIDSDTGDQDLSKWLDKWTFL